MGLLSKLFGTKEAVDNIVNKDNGLLTQFGGWIGSLNYTDEEKAEADQQVREWGIRQLDALAPFKVVQRILAFATSFIWGFVAISVVVAIFIEGIVNVKTIEIANGVETITQNSIVLVEPLLQFAASDYVLWPTLAVYSLYFTGGVVDSIKRKVTS